jgi:hypothetical protein
MMGRLLARQAEDMKAGQEEIKARQDKADAEAKALQDQFKEHIKDNMEPLLKGLRS